MTSISIIGPGAIGGTLAARLSQNPDNRVSICARTSFDRLILETPAGRLEATPRVLTAVGDAEPVDWIIMATKTYQVAKAAVWLKPQTGDNTRLAVVQNGVEHVANLAPYFEKDRIVPVIIDCPARRDGPGRIVQRGEIDMALPSDKNAADFADLFDDGTVRIELTDNWTSAAWKKLCINAAGAVFALTGRTAEVANDAVAADVMARLIRECIAVGRAEGAVIDDGIVDRVIEGQRKAPPDASNSIQADLIARQPMEWDARNGVIARLGAKYGIDAPYNRMAADLFKIIEASYL